MCVLSAWHVQIGRCIFVLFGPGHPGTMGAHMGVSAEGKEVSATCECAGECAPAVANEAVANERSCK